MQLKNLFIPACLLYTLTVNAQQTPAVGPTPTIFRYVEVMPKANYDLSKYLSENIHYPDTARKYNIEGRVLIKFVVTEDGIISDCQILKGIGGGCDEEALRVIKNLPPWIPGKQDGKPVKVYYTLPIVFKLTD